MANPKVTDILNKIDAQESQLDNVKALVTGLRDQIAAGATSEDLDKMLAEIAANDTKLTEVLTHNVPPGAPVDGGG